MDEKRAQAQVELIRSMMERASRYSNFSAASAFIAVAAVVGGWVLCHRMNVDFTVRGMKSIHLLLNIWGGVFVVSFAALIVGSMIKAKSKGERFWTRLALEVFLSILPGLFAGAALTGYVAMYGFLRVLPGMWMLLYGVLLLSARLISRPEVHVLGLTFLTMGGIVLFTPGLDGLTVMGLGFSIPHFLFGLYYLFSGK